MPKVCITGTTRGLGKILAEQFKSNGWEVVELNRHDMKVEPGIGCDLYINNSYANGNQVHIFNELYASVGKMIVMGSIAADYPDPAMPEYSLHKRELKERVMEVANTGKYNILLLELTGESYNNAPLILNTIDFWLDNPTITSVSFVPGKPNK